MPLQLKILNDFRPKQAIDVRSRRDFVTRPDFFGDAGTTDQFAALQYQHTHARSCQISRGHKAIVAGSNDDDVNHHDMEIALLRPSNHKRSRPARGASDQPSTETSSAEVSDTRTDSCCYRLKLLPHILVSESPRRGRLAAGFRMTAVFLSP